MNAVRNGSRFNLLPINTLSREMGRIFDEMAVSDNRESGAPVSIWENDSHYYFEFDVPGVMSENVDVTVVEDVLTVATKREAPEGQEYLRQERSYAASERKFSLPARVDADNIEASLKHGVLTVALPKAPEATAKKIEIKTE